MNSFSTGGNAEQAKPDRFPLHSRVHVWLLPFNGLLPAGRGKHTAAFPVASGRAGTEGFWLYETPVKYACAEWRTGLSTEWQEYRRELPGRRDLNRI